MPSSTTNMGLVTWTNLTDFFSHTDLVNNWTRVDSHDHVPLGAGGNGGAPIPAAGIQNGAITGSKLGANAVGTANIQAGAVTATQIAAGAITPDKFSESRGSSAVAATETRSSSTYGLMTTPDRVTGVVLPANGLIAVAYQATWQESISGAGRAAIFVGANQLRVAQGLNSGTGSQAAATNGTTGAVNHPLFTGVGGLYSRANAGSNYAGDVTSGQALGFISIGAGANTLGFELNGTTTYSTTSDSTSLPFLCGNPCYIFAAAGTYDISIQFKATSGTVTASNRKLWVWTVDF